MWKTAFFAMGLALSTASSLVAQTTEIAPLSADWCALDAPGQYRELRAKARALGERTPGNCPLGGEPESLPERLVVPLPCGRALELMRVDVPADTVLDHIRGDFGGAPEGAGILTVYAQGSRSDVLAGTFSRKRERAGGGPAIGYGDLGYRSYYMASHEWSEIQHALVVGGALRLWSDPETTPSAQDNAKVCAIVQELTDGMRFSDVLPQGGLSWYDAQAIVGALNDYVMSESRRRLARGQSVLLPWEQGSSGFFRLPSEVEWEYAAYGGAPGALNRSATHLIRDPADDVVSSELSDIAVMSDGRNSGHLRGVGSLAPNLAGLYDVVGNIAEMTHDLFSMVRPDSRHGGRGGIVLRGGNTLTPSAVLGIGHRQELPLHTLEGAGRASFGGVRVMLAAPILARGFDPDGNRAPDRQNTELPKFLEREHSQLVAIEETAGAEFRKEAQRLLEDLQVESDQAVAIETSRVAAVRRALEQSEASLNAARQAEISARIRAAADSIFAMRSLSAISITWHEKLDQAEELVLREFPESQRPAAEARIRKARQDVHNRTQIIDTQIRELASTITGLAKVEERLLDRLFERQETQLREAGIELYDEFLIWDRLKVSVARLRSRPNQDHFEWLRSEFDIFRDDRISRWGEQ